jgi:hypothetical protein
VILECSLSDFENQYNIFGFVMKNEIKEIESIND